MPQVDRASDALYVDPRRRAATRSDADRLPVPPALPVRDRRVRRPAPVELRRRPPSGVAPRCIRQSTSCRCRARSRRRRRLARGARASRSTSRSSGGILRRTVGHVHAVDGVDLAVAPGTTLGLVGESGSGKSTLGRLLLRLLDPDRRHDPLRRPRRHRGSRSASSARCGAACRWCSRTRTRRSTRARRSRDSLAEPMRAHLDVDGTARTERVAELLEPVGLERRAPQPVPARVLRRSAASASRSPARSRSSPTLARARRAGEQPRRVDPGRRSSTCCATSSSELGLAYLFIAHDLAVVRHVSDRIAVMYLGRIVEQGPADEVYATPEAPLHRGAAVRDPGPGPGARNVRASASCSRATSRRRRRRPPAAASTPAAR